MRQTPQRSTGNARNCVYQEPSLTYSTSTARTQDLNHGSFMGHQAGYKLKGGRKIGPVESDSKGAPTKNAATSPLNFKTNTVIVHLPLGDNLQCLEMKNSEMINLLNLPNSLAKQANNTVQVLKRANGRTSTDGGVALLKSVGCLSH